MFISNFIIKKISEYKQRGKKIAYINADKNILDELKEEHSNMPMRGIVGNGDFEFCGIKMIESKKKSEFCIICEDDPPF